MKKIISAATAFCILIPTLLFSTQAASDNDREAFAVNEDLYTLLETNPGAKECSNQVFMTLITIQYMHA